MDELEEFELSASVEQFDHKINVDNHNERHKWIFEDDTMRDSSFPTFEMTEFTDNPESSSPVTDSTDIPVDPESSSPGSDITKPTVDPVRTSTSITTEVNTQERSPTESYRTTSIETQTSEGLSAITTQYEITTPTVSSTTTTPYRLLSIELLVVFFVNESDTSGNMRS